jgi:hypothetical protein
MTALAFLLCLLGGLALFADQTVANDLVDYYGRRQRADGAQQIIVLAVQRGISALPPASAQSFSYKFDPDLDAVVRDKRMGPIAFRGADTIGARRFSVQVSTSYFEIDESLDPIDYKVDHSKRVGVPNSRTRFGLDVRTRVGLTSIAASYGISRRVELTANVPVVVTDTDLADVYATRRGCPSCAPVDSPPGDIDRGLADRTYVVARIPFDAPYLTVSGEKHTSGVDVNTGTNVGLGRIGLGAKISLLKMSITELAFSPEFLLPSPNEEEYAGSASAAILPRLVGSIALADWARLHLDLGYEWDFDSSELRRFVWTAGMSFPLGSRFDFDAGFSGSEYQEGIAWTPRHATYGSGALGAPMTALEDNELGTTFVDLVLGLKLALTDRIVLGGVVSVPIDSNEARPDVAGTLALEFFP